jgi:hypothetical protein
MSSQRSQHDERLELHGRSNGKRGRLHRGRQVTHVIGSGPAGLLAIIQLQEKSRAMGLASNCVMYGQQLFGSAADPTVAAVRCQAWCHPGSIFAQTQPHVALSLWRASVPVLRRLAAPAFRENIPGVLLEATTGASDHPGLEESLRAVGIPHRRLPSRVLRSFVPTIPRNVLSGMVAYLTPDTVIDLPVLQWCLARKALAGGMRHVPAQVMQLVPTDKTPESIAALVLSDGQSVSIAPDDEVVLACGAGIHRLLQPLGVNPLLRFFQSHLVAAHYDLRALLAVVGGGINAVPHPQPDGRTLAVFGNSHRREIPANTGPLAVAYNTLDVHGVCADVANVLGIDLPSDDIISWTGVKTEYVTEGNGAQGHHVARVAGLGNVWTLIPGKLTGSPAAADELARQMLSLRLGQAVSRSIWQVPGPLPNFAGALTNVTSE